MIVWIILWLVAANLLAFTLFGLDKRRAAGDRRRVRESDLLGVAMLGGTGGAYLGRHHFRHKTVKQPFSTRLHLIALVQAGAAAAVLMS